MGGGDWNRRILGREPDLVGKTIRKGFSSLGGEDQFTLGIKKACGAWLEVRPDLPSVRPLLNGATIEARKEITGYKIFLARRHFNLLTRLFEISNISKSRMLECINFLNSVRGDPRFFCGLREKRNERDI